jgi:hypothetical protein
MLLFCDTEFTGLGQPNPRLISLALVPADGGNPFYAEIAEGDGWERSDCNSFVLREVLPILNGGKYIVPSNELRHLLLAWFTGMPRSVQVACDSVIDFRFLKDILDADWPNKLEKQYFDLSGLITNSIYDQTVTRYYTHACPPHNALADAQAYRLGWLAWMDAKKISNKVKN